ncbi:2,3-dimethylmalate lyase [Oligella ureolytica]|uniref:2-methylisocitrate lyase n=1 Tax=Oligella ureolytica TaxID=90244 RepID=A0A378XE37_9BURK|nr:oxaloacetate decarboxylase [Oligella ureolytica]QPT40374.1 oxaloacetate decarboxylase [Oligella ureolytica]SUA50870.1 2,3-dimethylmalate lyase [Oligella ureolytica]
MSLKTCFHNKELVLAPGVYDAFSALVASKFNYKALYVSGAGIAYTKLGRPDVGLVSMTEVAESIRFIADRVDTPLIVDADNGYGNALNVQRCIRLFENSGAKAIQLEDQSLPKRCGHLKGKSLISTQEMVGKIKAAVDTRKSDELLIIARTDAISVEGYNQAIERASLYEEAGADLLFIEAPQNLEQLNSIAERFSGQIPLLANMVEGGDTPILTAEELYDIGFSLVIFPGGVVRAISKTLEQYYASLSQHGNNVPFAKNMNDFKELNLMLETDELLTLSQKYE